MDAFKEMLEIEEEFGAIPLGNEKPKKQENTVSHHQEIENRSLWYHLANATLNNTNTKFKMFLNLIDQATLEKDTLAQMQKKKILNEFLAAKTGKAQTEKAKELRKLQDPELFKEHVRNSIKKN